MKSICVTFAFILKFLLRESVSISCKQLFIPQCRDMQEVIIEDRMEKERLRAQLEKEQKERDAATKVTYSFILGKVGKRIMAMRRCIILLSHYFGSRSCFYQIWYFRGIMELIPICTLCLVFF